MVLIICTKNELNLTNRYWDMVPDKQKSVDGRTDGMDDGQTDARTTPKLYPSDFVGEKMNILRFSHYKCIRNQI